MNGFMVKKMALTRGGWIGSKSLFSLVIFGVDGMTPLLKLGRCTCIQFCVCVFTAREHWEAEKIKVSTWQTSERILDVF
jgi:hypothetical protein